MIKAYAEGGRSTRTGAEAAGRLGGTVAGTSRRSPAVQQRIREAQARARANRR